MLLLCLFTPRLWTLIGVLPPVKRGLSIWDILAQPNWMLVGLFYGQSFIALILVSKFSDTISSRITGLETFKRQEYGVFLDANYERIFVEMTIMGTFRLNFISNPFSTVFFLGLPSLILIHSKPRARRLGKALNTLLVLSTLTTGYALIIIVAYQFLPGVFGLAWLFVVMLGYGFLLPSGAIITLTLLLVSEMASLSIIYKWKPSKSEKLLT